MGLTGGKRRTRRSRGRFSRSRRVRPRIHPNMGSWGYTSSESMASMCENGRCRTRRWVNGREMPSRGMGRGRGPSSRCHSGPSSRCRCGCGRRGCRCGLGRPSPFADTHTHTQGFPMGFSDGHFSSGMDLPRLFRLPWTGEQIKLVKLPSTESKVRKSSSSGVSSSRKSGRRSKRSKRSSKKSKSKSKRKVRKGTSSSSRSVKNLRSRIRRTRR